MALRTGLTEAFGIEHPIISAPMASPRVASFARPVTCYEKLQTMQRDCLPKRTSPSSKKLNFICKLARLGTPWNPIHGFLLMVINKFVNDMLHIAQPRERNQWTEEIRRSANREK